MHYSWKTTSSDAQTQVITVTIGAKAYENRHEDVIIHRWNLNNFVRLDRWWKSWDENVQKRHIHFRRQQGGEVVMIWTGIIKNEFISPVWLPDEVKLSSAAYCQLLESASVLWLDDVPLQRKLKVDISARQCSVSFCRGSTSILFIDGIERLPFGGTADMLSRSEPHWKLAGDSEASYLQGGEAVDFKRRLVETIETCTSSNPSCEIKKKKICLLI